MAIFEVFHVVASSMLVDPNDPQDIPQGALVALDPADGMVMMGTFTEVVTQNGGVAVGVAADSRSQGTTSYTAESGSALADATDPLRGSLIVGSAMSSTPGRRYTQNRVSDYYNEVLASGKLTVYHSGGEFWTDQYEADDVWVPGALCYLSDDNAGQFSSTVSVGGLVGQTLNTPTAYPSGVPGVDTGFTHLPEGGNSLSFGNFLRVKLLI